MKRMMLAVVTAAALVVGGLFASSAEAHGPGYCGPGYGGYGGYGGGYGYNAGYGGGYGGYGGYGYGAPGVNIALRAPNIAITSGFAGYGQRVFVPYGAGYIGGYQPYQQFRQPAFGLYYGY